MHASTHRAYCLPFCSVHAVCGPHLRVKPLTLLQPVLVHSLTMKLEDCPEPNLNLLLRPIISSLRFIFNCHPHHASNSETARKSVEYEQRGARQVWLPGKEFPWFDKSITLRVPLPLCPWSLRQSSLTQSSCVCPFGLESVLRLLSAFKPRPIRHMLS